MQKVEQRVLSDHGKQLSVARSRPLVVAVPRDYKGCITRLYIQVFPPTLVKEDEALPETADCRMDLTVVLRWGHDGPVVVCNPVLR